MDKNALRKEIRSRKKSYSQEQLLEKSESILRKLELHPLFQQANRVMLYASLPDEVQTLAFIEKWQKTKTVILPTVVGDDIIPVQSSADAAMQEGDFHILEPQNMPYIGDFDLIVVPGMAFDRQGSRLGRGKGFYDRFLAKHPKIPTIGLCFDFQVVEYIPKEPHDIIIGEVIS